MCCLEALQKLFRRSSPDEVEARKPTGFSTEGVGGTGTGTGTARSSSGRGAPEPPRYAQPTPQSQSKDLGRSAEKPSVADVYKKIKEEKKTEGSRALGDRLDMVKETQVKMGIAPNIALYERYVERAKKVEQTQEGSSLLGNQSRLGDISFSFPISRKSTMKSLKNDDTLCAEALRPNTAGQAAGTPRASPDNEELLEEDEVENEQPNSVNYMYNDKEIAFTCRDMMTQLDPANVEAATGNLSGAQEPKTFNPRAETEELTKRGIFDCHTLRRNTFVSNMASMPDVAEKTEGDLRRADNPVPPTQTVRFEPVTTDCAGGVPRLQNSVRSESLSCAKTLDSACSLVAPAAAPPRGKAGVERRRSKGSVPTKNKPAKSSGEKLPKNASKEARVMQGSKEVRTGRPVKVMSRESRAGSREAGSRK